MGILERGNLDCQLVGWPVVVALEHRNQGTPAFRKRNIVSLRESRDTAFGQPHISDSRVGVALYNFARAIYGSVVNNDLLPARIRLKQHAVDALTDVWLKVMHSGDDRYHGKQFRHAKLL